MRAVHPLRSLSQEEEQALERLVRLYSKERGKNAMEKILVLFSIPIFLTLMLLLSLFVLAHYSGNEPAKTAPAEVKAPDTSESADSLAA